MVTFIAITSVCNTELGVCENFHDEKYKWNNLRAITTKTPDINSQLASSEVIRITSARTNPCTFFEASNVTTRNILTSNKDIGPHRQDSESTSALFNTEQTPSTIHPRQSWTLNHTPRQLLTTFQTQHEARDGSNTQNTTHKATCCRESLTDKNAEFSWIMWL